MAHRGSGGREGRSRRVQGQPAWGRLPVLATFSLLGLLLTGCQLAAVRPVSEQRVEATVPPRPATVPPPDPATVPATVPPSPRPASSPDPARAVSPLATPAANLADTFAAICSASPGALSLACEQAELVALAGAGQKEGLGQLQLPAGFLSLPAAEQMFVLIDEERVSRGLAPIEGLTVAGDQQAAAAAAAGSDPPLGDGIVASNWTGDFGPLGAVYDWLYNDGWGGSRAATSNGECTFAGAAGCWAHRANLLLRPGGQPLWAGSGCAPWAGDQGMATGGGGVVGSAHKSG